MIRMLMLLSTILALASAAIRIVPGQYPTIQSGLNAAQSGDTVVVAPGTYNENIVWPSRDGIALLGVVGAEKTVIDGQGTGRVIEMAAMTYTRATAIHGFTIRNGYVNLGSSGTGGGAGILAVGNPVISHNHIFGNRLFGWSGQGAGVLATGAPLFHANRVEADTNFANGPGYRLGGGVYVAGPGVIHSNAFIRNAAISNTSGHQYGGGMYAEADGVVIVNNLFVENAAVTSSSGIIGGGGIYVTGAAYVAGNTIYGNMTRGGINAGGGIYTPGNTAIIKNNIIVSNSSDYHMAGGGIHADRHSLSADYNNAWNNLPDNYANVAVGPNSLSEDPLFAIGRFGAFYLSQTAAGQPITSLCVDAGDTLTMTNPLHIDSLFLARTTRSDDVTDTSPLDLGYHACASVESEKNDVYAIAVVAPNDTIELGTTVTPQAMIFNFGNRPATFPVSFHIGDAYSQTVSGITLTPGESRIISFPQWTADPVGSHPVTAFTALANDENRSNDTTRSTINVYRDDVGATAIIAPTGEVGSGTSVTPQATVQNFGSRTTTFPVTLRIGDVYNQTVSGITLAPGQTTTVSFPQWTANPVGSHPVTGYTALANDQNRANDTTRTTITVIPGTAIAESELPFAPVVSQVKPNPLDRPGSLLLNLPVTERVNIRLYNAAGQMVLILNDGPLPSGQHRLPVDITGLAEGPYLMRIVIGNNSVIRKLVIR